MYENFEIHYLYCNECKIIHIAEVKQVVCASIFESSDWFQPKFGLVQHDSYHMLFMQITKWLSKVALADFG